MEESTCQANVLICNPEFLFPYVQIYPPLAGGKTNKGLEMNEKGKEWNSRLVANANLYFCLSI